METKEYMENKKTSHDSSSLGDSTVQWHQEAVLGSGERRPRIHRMSKMWYSMLYNGKSHSSYKSMSIKPSQMFNSI